MLIVLQKVETSNPAADTQHYWRVAAEYQSDEDATDERLRGLGPGELKVLQLDPESPNKIKELRKVQIAAPAKPRLTEVK